MDFCGCWRDPWYLLKFRSGIVGMCVGVVLLGDGDHRVKYKKVTPEVHDHIAGNHWT